MADGEATIHTAAGQATGPLVDVSEGGLQILCHISGSVGELVEICFLPQDYPEEITLPGRVVRIQPDRVGIDLTQTASWPATWQELQKFYAPSKRLHERYPAEGEARIYAGSNEAKCVVENVSRDGLQIRTDIPVSLSSRVEVRFTPPGYSEQITAAGRVASIRGDYIGIDFTQVSSWRANWRKLVAFRTVSQKKQDGPLTPDSLIAKIATIQKEAAASPAISAKTAALWKMESLGVTFGRVAQPGDTLSDPSLPVEARPIAHVGMGGAAVEVANFDCAEITRVIDSLAHPEYRLFSYEQIGAMLGVYEKTVPRLMLGLKPLNRPDDTRQFIRSFPDEEVQRLISHGYGRLLYFNSKDIHAAFRNIQKRDFLDLRAAVQGMAFGYTMVNHNELEVVLETGDSLLDPALVRAFKAGLVYALEFWEWESPGFLQSLRVPGPRAEELIAIACAEIESARKQGILKPFVVERLGSA